MFPTCAAGYFLALHTDKNVKCTACKANSNAATCTGANAADITSCNSGYFVAVANGAVTGCTACIANGN